MVKILKKNINVLEFCMYFLKKKSTAQIYLYIFISSNEFYSSIFIDKMSIRYVYWSMELIPAYKLPITLFSDFVANLAIFCDFMCMEKLDLANFT